MVDKQKPMTSLSNSAVHDSITTHPAFGMISVNRVNTNGTTLFGSDLNHQEYINLEVYEGQSCEHSGSTCYMRQRRLPIVSVNLSVAQWATLVSSFGLGEGIPCTLRSKREGEFQQMPFIEAVETTKQRFDRQIKDAVARETAHLQEVLAAITSLSSKGNAGKKELQELQRLAASRIGNLPSNFAFTNTLIEEQMEHIVAAGKAELEAVATGVAQRLGVKTMQDLIALENKEE